MESPLMILPCLSGQLELYNNRVIIRPLGVWACVSRTVEHIIPLHHIEMVRLIRSTPRTTGVIELIRRESRPKSVYVLFSHRHAQEAIALYETLDDLVTRKDVLNVIRTLDSS